MVGLNMFSEVIQMLKGLTPMCRVIPNHLHPLGRESVAVGLRLSRRT